MFFDSFFATSNEQTIPETLALGSKMYWVRALASPCDLVRVRTSWESIG